jgi:hypothetical protein
VFVFQNQVVVKRSLTGTTISDAYIAFPPTGIRASVEYGTILYPTGTHRITLKLDRLLDYDETTKTVTLWRVKWISWQLNEKIKTFSPSCQKHKLDRGVELMRIGSTRVDERSLGGKDLHQDWKCTYEGLTGIAEAEFGYVLQGCDESRYVCDEKTLDGSEITHSLKIDITVHKEHAPLLLPSDLI